MARLDFQNNDVAIFNYEKESPPPLPLEIPIADWSVTVGVDDVNLTFTWGIPENEHQNMRGSEAYIQSSVECNEETSYPIFLERNFESEIALNPNADKYPNYKFYKASATLTKTDFEANSGSKTWNWVTDYLRFIWVRWEIFGKEVYPSVFPCGVKIEDFPYETSMDVIISGTTTYSDEGAEFIYEYRTGPSFAAHLLNGTVNTYRNGVYSKTQIENETKKLNLVSPIMTFSNEYTSWYTPDAIANKSYISLAYVKKEEPWDPSTAEGQKVKTAYAIFYDESHNGLTNGWADNQLKVPAIFDDATKTYSIQTTSLLYTSWHQPDHMYKVKLFAEDIAGNLASMDHTNATYGQELRIRVLEKEAPIFGTDPGWVSDGAVIGKTIDISPYNIYDASIDGNFYQHSGLDISTFKAYLDGAQIAVDHDWGWYRLDGSNSDGTIVVGAWAAENAFKITNLSGGNHTLKYYVSDNDGNTATKTSTFIAHAAGPDLEIIDPSSDIDTNNKIYNLKFRAKSTDNVAVTKFTIGVTNIGASLSREDIVITTIPEADADGYINVTQDLILYSEGTSLPHKVSNLVTVTAYDEFDSTTVITRTITVDTIPPVIYDVNVENTTINAITDKIKIHFRLIDTSVTDIILTQVGNAGGRREVEVGTEVIPEITYQMSPDVPNLPEFKCEYREDDIKIEDLTKTSLEDGKYKFSGVTSKFTVTEGKEKIFAYHTGADYRKSDHVVTGVWAPFVPVNAPTINLTAFSSVGDTGENVPNAGVDLYMTKTSFSVHVEGIVNGDRAAVDAGKIMVTVKNGVATTGYTNFSRTLYRMTNGTCTLTSTENIDNPNEYEFSGDISISEDVNGFFDLIFGYSESGALGEGDVTTSPIRVYRDPSDNTRIVDLNSYHPDSVNVNMDIETEYRYKPYVQFFWKYGFESKKFTCTLNFPEAPNESDRVVEIGIPQTNWTSGSNDIIFESPSYTYFNRYLPTLNASLFENPTQVEVVKTVPMILRGYMPNIDGSDGKTEIFHREFSLELRYTRTRPKSTKLTFSGIMAGNGNPIDTLQNKVFQWDKDGRLIEGDDSVVVDLSNGLNIEGIIEHYNPLYPTAKISSITARIENESGQLDNERSATINSDADGVATFNINHIFGKKYATSPVILVVKVDQDSGFLIYQKICSYYNNAGASRVLQD